MHESNERLLKLFRKASKTELYPIFERHGVDPEEGVESLVNEISLDGANTIASIFRGWKGVPYREIVIDVANKMKVDIDEESKLEDIEVKIISNVLKQSLDELPKREREEVEKLLQEIANKSNIKSAVAISSLSAAGLAALFQSIEGETVILILRKIIAIIARRSAVGFAGASGVASIAGMVMPLISIGIIGGALVGLAGPANRKIIPTVLEVALLRMKYGKEQ